MKKLKIKKQNSVSRKKKAEIRKRGMADTEAMNLLFYDEEFPLGFPVGSLFKVFKYRLSQRL